MKIIATFCLWLCSVSPLFAEFAYVVNYGSNNISVVDLTNSVAIGYVNNGPFNLQNPLVVVFTPDATKAFVLSQTNNSVFVIDPTQNLIIAEVNAGAFPFSGPRTMDITSDGTKAYVTNPNANLVSIIDVATNTVTGYVNPGAFPFNYPFDVVFNSAGTLAGVTNFLGSNISVIDEATDTVIQYVTNGLFPTPSPRNLAYIDDTAIYVTNYSAPSSEAVAIVSALTETVTGYVNPNSFPFANANDVEVSSDLQHAYIGNDGTNQISIVNIPTNTVTGFINASFQNPSSFIVTNDNKTLYVANTLSNIVSIIDLTTNTQIGVINSSTFPFNTPVSIDIGDTINTTHLTSIVPNNVQGHKKKNVFASQTDLINVITWGPPPGAVAALLYYTVYRDEALTDVAAVIPSTGPFQFIDHDRQKGHTYTYYIVASESVSFFSAPGVVSLSW